MTDLSQLIERVEAATGPDRELDVAIGFAVGRIRERDGNYLYATGNDSDMVVEPNAYDDHNAAQPLSYFTASIDAALTLLGDRPFIVAWAGQWAGHMPNAGKPIFEAVIPDDTADYEITMIGDMTEIGPSASASTAPLALLAAILRARQAADTEGQS